MLYRISSKRQIAVTVSVVHDGLVAGACVLPGNCVISNELTPSMKELEEKGIIAITRIEESEIPSSKEESPDSDSLAFGESLIIEKSKESEVLPDEPKSSEEAETDLEVVAPKRKRQKNDNK